MKPPIAGIERERPSAVAIWAIGAVGIAAIGALDYYTGVELRVYPLYYGPIALLAWYSGRPGALLGTLLASAVWLTANRLAGLTFSTNLIALDNTVMQGASFLIVGLLIATVRDALSRERALSRTDPLTSMLNTRAFHNDSFRTLATCRRGGRPVTVACIDLDDFKAVNDQFGHQAGDDLLRSVAGRLVGSIRPSDIAARVGGDEFVVLFPDIGAREAALTTERLRTALTSGSAPGIRPVKCCIGTVTYLRPPEQVAEMVQRADAQLYAAKTAGKDQIAVLVVE